MLKVLSKLKQSWISVIFIVLLLVVQAICDLTLPEYTAKIVNTGIQSGGIENASPDYISESSMNTLLLFTDKDNEILSKYTVIDKLNYTVDEFDSLKNKYPILEKEPVYEVKKLEENERDELNSLMGKPLLVLATISSEEESEKIKSEILKVVPEEQKEYVQSMSLLEICKNMPEEQFNMFFGMISSKLDEMQDSIIEQAAKQQIKVEYKKIGIDTDKVQNHYIIVTGIKMLLISCIILVSAIGVILLSSRVAAKLAKTLREKIFKKVLSFSNKEFSEFSTASLITRSTNDIQQIQSLITMLFRIVIYAPIIGIGGFFKVLTQSDGSLAWIIGLAILVILIIVTTLFIIAMPKFKKLQDLIDRINLVAREKLTGLPVIRAFNTEEKENARFEKANVDLTKTNLFVNKSMSFMFPSMMLVMNYMSLLIVWFSAKGVDAGTMQIGNMMAFIQYAMQIVISFLFISMISIILPRASVAARRINEVLDTEELIKENASVKTVKSGKRGYVEFKNVCFKYPDGDEELLSDITFTAKPGETTAIIGSTGSGKSTLINLIPRFYDITSGELLVDGVDVKKLPFNKLRKIIGFVPQKGILFSGTIESNIKYGEPTMSDKRMRDAAKIAQATEFIDSKPKKYKTPIAQGGSNVSGGQKQRLSIARAIAINPEILIFDDSFSALDFKTDRALRTELAKITDNKTVIIVAQRINTILNADQIIVLDEGKVVGKGTHAELMKNNEVYKQIALSQLSEAELSGKEGK